MAKVKFNLTKEHILLLKHIGIVANDNKIMWDLTETEGENFREVETILKGKIPPDDLLKESFEYNEEVKEHYKTLLSELPTALAITLEHMSINPDEYYRLSYQTFWNKVK